MTDKVTIIAKKIFFDGNYLFEILQIESISFLPCDRINFLADKLELNGSFPERSNLLCNVVSDSYVSFGIIFFQTLKKSQKVRFENIVLQNDDL